jgi:hypothetical protein
MFESGRFERAELAYQRDMITIMILLVIFLALLYYMSVFMSEVCMLNIEKFKVRLHPSCNAVADVCVAARSLSSSPIRSDAEQNPLKPNPDWKCPRLAVLRQAVWRCSSTLCKCSCRV